MFEKEIKFIYDVTINRLKKAGNSYTLSQIQEAGVHPAIVHYISSEIDYLIYEDRQKLLKESVFDYYGEQIDNYFQKINEEIKKHKKFSFEYISKLVLQAVSFNVNYLCRPNWALSRFLFDNGNEKSVVEIKLILNYVYFYDYLRNVILSYLGKKNILSITKVEIDALFIKIDKAGIDSNRYSIIEAAVQGLSDFFNYESVNKTTLPFNAIEQWFIDKNIQAYFQKFKEQLKLSEKNPVYIKEFLRAAGKPLMEIPEFVQENSREPLQKEIEQEIEPIVIDSENAIEQSIEEKIENAETDSNEIPAIVIINEEIADIEKDMNLEQIDVEDNLELELEPVSESKLEEQIISEELAVNKDFNSATFEEERIISLEESVTEDSADFLEKQSNEKLPEPEEIDENETDDNYTESISQINDNEKLLIDEVIDEDNILEIPEPEVKFTGNREDETVLNSIRTEIDILELMENKKMNSVIEKIFDYDMEEFSTLIDDLTYEEEYNNAEKIIEKFYTRHQIKPGSKEAVVFKEIIKEYYERKN